MPGPVARPLFSPCKNVGPDSEQTLQFTRTGASKSRLPGFCFGVLFCFVLVTDDLRSKALSTHSSIVYGRSDTGVEESQRQNTCVPFMIWSSGLNNVWHIIVTH